MPCGCRTLLLVLAIFVTGSAVHAQAPVIIGDKKDVRVEFLYGPRNVTIHGYEAFWFQLNNLSKKEPRTVTITVPRMSHSSPQLRGTARTIELKPGAIESMVIWYPPLPLRGWDMEFKVDGRMTQNVFYGQGYVTDRGMQQRKNVQLHVLGSPGSNSQIRYQQNLSRAGLAKLDPAFQYRQTDINKYFSTTQWVTGSPLGRPNRPQNEAVFSPHWLSYSVYDGVVFSVEDWTALPENVRQGVLRYVECGGSLLIQGAWNPPEHWKRSQVNVGAMAAYHVGFGECLVMPEKDHNKYQPQQWRYLAESWVLSGSPFHVHRTASEAHAAFKIVDDVEVPVRGLFGLMVGFVILIGPINIYVLSQKKMRIWMLATVPAISTVTCLAVLGYMLATEGFETHSRVESVTYLDENTGRAATVGWIGIYATITPSGGLHFTEDTELTPQWDVGGYRNYSSRKIDWTKGQDMHTGWVTPRVPTHFLARKSEERKERLVVRKNAQGKLAIVNPYGETLKSIHVATSKGTIYSATAVAAGAEAVLETQEFTCDPANKDKLRELYFQGWLNGSEAMTKRPDVYLRPGCYVAVFDSSPFLEDGMAAVDRRRANSLVFGVMKEPVNEN